ncbi:ComEC/Rec2 family competence protein [Epilithonimonas hispanica]|uniref:ComEC family competence protein n=1 Tax=Epilithonimonas hispanica TaxID=358687 RepID=A0A3D9CVI4_9FLAO|nr:ComEC/Rec2 family competence protein [Epilithonimonas hispanica]REC69739.1 ComEC family competence protein [Epilithonimonas hispanica]
MTKQPLLILLLSFIAGILLQEFLVLDRLFVCLILIFSGVSLISIFIKTVFFQKIKYYLLGFFFFSIGIFVHFQNSEQPKLPILKEKETIVFQLNKKLNSNEKNRKYYVEILEVSDLKQKENFSFKTVISIPKDVEALDFMHYYKAEVYIHQPEETKNDFQFDYKKYLARQDVYFQAYLPTDILKTEKNSILFEDKIKQKRLDILNQINHSSLSPRIQEFLKGIILADRTEMDAETVKDFNQTGLVHLLAISGSHMVIIFWITLLIFNQILPVKFRKVSIVLSILLIWTFAIFIDFGSSVMRSCLMITCYYMMVLLQRKSDLLHSLALSAFILLMVDSNQLFDVGFQLSYVAVLGIWWLTNPIKNLFRKPKYQAEKFFYEISSMTFAAQIATLPLAIYYFHQFSFVSIIANLLIIPLSELIIVSSLLMVVLIAFGFSNIPFLYKGFDVFVDCILKIIHWFSDFESLMNKNIPLNILELSLLLLAIYFLKFLIKNILNPKNLLRFGFCLLAFFAVRTTINIYQYNKKEMLVHSFYKEKIVSVKDKNQLVFWMKENKNEDKIRDFVINPYLTSRRIKDFKINYIPADSEGFVYQGNKFELK